jgi:hypothetical protein
MMRVNCSDKQITTLGYQKGVAEKKAEKRNLNAQQRKISGRVTPGIVRAA